jgi:hypothetical protein
MTHDPIRDAYDALYRGLSELREIQPSIDCPVKLYAASHKLSQIIPPLASFIGPCLPQKEDRGETIRSAYHDVLHGISDLRAAAVPVPMLVYGACHALAYAVKHRPEPAPPIIKIIDFSDTESINDGDHNERL